MPSFVQRRLEEVAEDHEDFEEVTDKPEVAVQEDLEEDSGEAEVQEEVAVAPDVKPEFVYIYKCSTLQS